MLEKNIDLNMLVTAHTPPLPQATLDINQPISLHPELGRGFMGHPALIGHRPASEQHGWAGQFTFSSWREIKNGVVFVTLDADRGLELEIECVLDPLTDVLATRSRLTNIANTSITIEWLSAPILAPQQHFCEQLSFYGRWCAEFATERLPISIGLFKHENRRGRTSHEAFPGCILLGATTDEENGPCLAMHLGWSGNHH